MSLTSSAAWAERVTIINPGFEDPAVTSFNNGPITGWTISGGGAGVWNINAARLGFWNVAAPEGNQTAFVSDAPLPGSPASITQVLGEVLHANTVYTLSGQVGHGIGFGPTLIPPTVYTVDLLAGDKLLASVSGTGPEGSFTPFQLSFNSAESLFLGLPLAIRLSSSQPQTGFDDLRLDAVRPAVTADAGPDQTVDEGVAVTLDGSASAGQALTFSWTQLAGTDVAISDATAAQLSFTAPVLSGGFGAQTLTFELVVGAGGQSDSDTVDIVVRNVNHAPDADAGPDQKVQEGSAVQLHGRDSFDPDDDPLTYAWTQTAGTPVTLDLTDPGRPGFAAPLLDGGTGEAEVLQFELTVSDRDKSASDAVVVVVEQVNHPPAANAGPDQTAGQGSKVTLDGQASSDPDGDTLMHSWTQKEGPPVTLSSPSTVAPSFTAPEVDPGGAPLVFELTVSDGEASSAPDEVVITVLNANDLPRCDLAQPSKPVLWPPNHKLVAVTVTGVTDANGEVTIAVTAVTQDEPVNGLGDGDTSPDAVLHGEGVLLRNERAGSGNGRVYRVAFTATDGQGGTCSGSVNVGVPHNPGAPSIDSGRLYDSLLP